MSIPEIVLTAVVVVSCIVVVFTYVGAFNERDRRRNDND